jgi:hypothetical protein
MLCPPVLVVANNQSLCALLAQFVEELEDGEALVFAYRRLVS